MRWVRWILLLLYVALVLGLVGLGFYGSDEPGPMLVLTGVTLTSWAVFLCGAGTRELCRPIRKPRLLLPAIAAAFMLAILCLGLSIGFAELFRAEDEPQSGWFALSLLGIAWIFWGVVLFVYTRRLRRFHAILRMSQLIFAGSLAELLAAVPSHLIVSRRPGCLVGIGTMMGVIAGLFVMFWSFGPAICLLFLQEGYRRQRGRQPPVGDTLPRGGAPFQFHLRTIFTAMFLTGVLSGVLRIFWGRWPAMAVAGWLLLVLAIPLLMLLLALRSPGFWYAGLGLIAVLLGLAAGFARDADERRLAFFSIASAAAGLALWRLNTPRPGEQFGREPRADQGED